jgi:hypothetical protein
MMFLILASALLVTAYSVDPDPTKVCFPDVFQVKVTSLNHNFTAIYAYNFPEQTVAIRYNYGIRIVFNLTELKLCYIPGNSFPYSFKLPYDEFETIHYGPVRQCLPAGAKLLSPANTHLGLSPASLDIQAWEIDVGFSGNATIVVTNSSPAVPVFVRTAFRGADLPGIDPVVRHVLGYINAETSIDDSSILDIPETCL